MIEPRVQTAYDIMYAQARAAAIRWAEWRQLHALKIYLAVGNLNEGNWGAIDALADLIADRRGTLPTPTSSARRNP